MATTPKSNTKFWVEKFDRNVRRDAVVIDQLEAAGWQVLVAWECELASFAKVTAKAISLGEEIKGASR